MRWLLVILLILLAGTARPGFAESGGPRAVLITVPGQSATGLLREAADAGHSDGALSGVTQAAVNVAVPGPDTSASGYASLGTGFRIEWKQPGGMPAAPSLLLGPDGTAHLYPRQDLLPTVGGLGSALQAGQRRWIFLGDGAATTHPGYLASVTADGDLPQAGALPDSTAKRVETIVAAVRQADFVHAHLPASTTSAECLNLFGALSLRLDPQRDLLLLTSPDPGTPEGGSWPHLAPLLLWGGGWDSPSATSATTRRAGLVTNTDVAPTLLAHLGIPAPAFMEGHVLQPSDIHPETVIRLAWHARAVRRVGIPVLFAWGILALLGAAGIVVVVMRGQLRDLRSVWLWRLIPAMAVAFPVAFLFAGLSLSSTPTELVLRIVLAQLAILLVAAGLSRWQPPIVTVFALIVVVPALDLLTGGTLLFRSVMGHFLNSGVRFYGIGNEYEGLVLAASILLPFILQQQRAPGKTGMSVGWRRGTLGFWTLVLACVASPGLGADFGGALALGAGFLAGAILSSGRRLEARMVLGMVAGVAALGLLVMGLDLMRPPGARSHVGELAARALEQGGGVVLEVALRKVVLNLKLAATGYFLGSAAAVAALAAICYDRVGSEILRALANRPLIRTALLATGVGGIAALLLNDSGVVAGAMTAGCALLLTLDLVLADARRGDSRCRPTQDPPRPLV